VSIIISKKNKTNVGNETYSNTQQNIPENILVHSNFSWRNFVKGYTKKRSGR